mgnify:CR=1 FL=1
MSTSQFLVVLGLIFEFMSVAVTIRKLFWGYYKRFAKETFLQEIMQETRKEKKEGLAIVILLGVGMFLQGLAVFA